MVLEESIQHVFYRKCRIVKLKDKVVITGIGIVNPLGNNLQEYSKNLFDGKTGIREINKYKKEKQDIKVGGLINNIDFSKIPRRLNHKIDTFTRYSILASNEAIQSGNLQLESEDPYKIGVFVGNNSGGWDISERGFSELYQKGAEYVNPWQATAWFPAAPQGFISIKNKVKGYSKSFVAGKCSGSFAVKFAFESLVNGFNDIVLCGGTEAPITKLATSCYSQLGTFYLGKKYKTVHSFDQNTQGQILGEGSAFAILETEEHAIARKAQILGELVDINCTKDNSNNGTEYDCCIFSLLKRNNLSLEDISLFLPEGSGDKVSDQIEADFIKRLSPQTIITVPKMLYGGLYGASTMTDLINGLLFFSKNRVIGIDYDYKTINDIGLLKHTIDFNGNYILIANRSREGINTAVLVKKFGGK